VRLNLLDIDELHDVFVRVMPLAARVLDGADFTAEDIERECRDGRALAFYASGWGLVVCHLNPNRRHNDLELVVWLAVSFGPGQAVEEFSPELDEIARRMDAKRIVFSTFRPGWMRRPPPGWNLRDITFEREVAP
jgi:hypothetical protein